MCLLRFILLFPVFVTCYCDNFLLSKTLNKIWPVPVSLSSHGGIFIQLLVGQCGLLIPAQASEFCALIWVLALKGGIVIPFGDEGKISDWESRWRWISFREAESWWKYQAGKFLRSLESCGTKIFPFSPSCLCIWGNTQVSPICKSLRATRPCIVTCSRVFRKH